MRGRINSDLYSGIAINATTDQFEVSGGNIMAGDFVQYKYAAADRKTLTQERITNPATGGVVTTFNFHKVDDNLFITNTGVLYELSGDTLRALDSTTSTGKYIIDLGNHKYIIGCLQGITLFIEVDTVNKTIDLLSEVVVPNLDSNNGALIGLGVVGANKDKLVRWAYSAYTRNSSTGNVSYFNIYYVYDISDLENVTLIASHGSRSVATDIHVTMSDLLATVNNKWVFIASSSSGYTDNRAVYYITFDDNTNDFEYTSPGGSTPAINQQFLGNQTYYASSNVIYIPNNLAHDRYIITIGIGTGTTFGMNIIDTVGNTISSVNLWQSELVVRTGAYSSSYSIRGIGISEIDENGEFYLSSCPHHNNIDYGIGISKVKVTSGGSIEVVGELACFYPHSSIIYTVINPVNNGDETFVLMYVTNQGTTEGNGTYYYIANNVNGEMILGEQEDVVEPYDGSNPKMLMGVAATSGQIGDTIDVYMPMAIT